MSCQFQNLMKKVIIAAYKIYKCKQKETLEENVFENFYTVFDTSCCSSARESATSCLFRKFSATTASLKNLLLKIVLSDVGFSHDLD